MSDPGGVVVVVSDLGGVSDPGGSARSGGVVSDQGGCLIQGGWCLIRGVCQVLGGYGIPACTEADTLPPPWTDTHL